MMEGWGGTTPADEERAREQAYYLATVADRNTPAQVIPRARRIAGRRHAKKPNWVLAMDLYCVGSNYAWGICRDAGLDPEATSSPHHCGGLPGN